MLSRLTSPASLRFQSSACRHPTRWARPLLIPHLRLPVRRTFVMSHPSTIQAIGIEETGDYDVIRKLELPFPNQEPDHVLIKVEACGVNMIDTYFRYESFKPKTRIQVDRTSVQQRSLSHPIVPCCTRNRSLRNHRWSANGRNYPRQLRV
jgi:hypothetical protein